MSTETIRTKDMIARIREAAEAAAKGIRDPEAMRRACESMDRISEEVLRRNGILNIGTPAIRDLRDQ